MRDTGAADEHSADSAPDRALRDELIALLPALRAFAFSLTRDRSRADDLVQETLVKGWANLERFEQGTNLRAWLFTILRNTFYSERRKAWREVGDPDGEISGRLAEKPAHDGRIALNEFLAAFMQLPDDQREVLMLIGSKGFSYQEAAELCGCAVGTVKSRANRGRKRLAEILSLDPEQGINFTDKATLAVISGAGRSL